MHSRPEALRGASCSKIHFIHCLGSSRQAIIRSNVTLLQPRVCFFNEIVNWERSESCYITTPGSVVTNGGNNSSEYLFFSFLPPIKFYLLVSQFNWEVLGFFGWKLLNYILLEFSCLLYMYVNVTQSKTIRHGEIFIRVMHLECSKLENKAISSLVCNWMIVLWVCIRTEYH